MASAQGKRKLTASSIWASDKDINEACSRKEPRRPDKVWWVAEDIVQERRQRPDDPESLSGEVQGVQGPLLVDRGDSTAFEGVA